MQDIATIESEWKDKLLLYLRKATVDSSKKIDGQLTQIKLDVEFPERGTKVNTVDCKAVFDKNWRDHEPEKIDRITSEGIFKGIGLPEKNLKQQLRTANKECKYIGRIKEFNQKSGGRAFIHVLTKEGLDEAERLALKYDPSTETKEEPKDLSFKEEVEKIFEIGGYKLENRENLRNKKDFGDIDFEIFASKEEMFNKIYVGINTHKNEQKLKNDSILFKEFLKNFRKAKKKKLLDGAVFVHYTGFTDEVKKLSEKFPGVKLLTFEELTTNLFCMDFTSYLEQYIKDFEDSLLCKKYISAIFEIVAYNNGIKLKNTPSTFISKKDITIDDYISEWIIRNDSKQICILGEGRRGKTSFSRHFMYIQAKRYIEKKDNRIPIYVDLKSYRKIKDIYKVIENILESGGVEMDSGNFKKLMRLGRFVLIFDGFDEMFPDGDENARVYAFSEIAKCVMPRTKVIITSRPNYFTGIDEIAKIKNNRYHQSEPDVLEFKEKLQFDILYLKPLNKDKLNEYLDKPIIKELLDEKKLNKKIVEEIIFSNNLEDLIKSPADLHFFISSPGINSGNIKEINIGELYDNWFTDLVKRDYIKKFDVKSPIEEDDKKRFFEDLSWHMFTTGRYEFSYAELDNKIKEKFDIDRSLSKQYTSDIKTAPFLTIKDNLISFEVTSVRDFLVAKKFLREINENNPKTFSRVKITKEIANFIKFLNPNVQNLWAWISKTKGMSFEKVQYLGGNAVTLLNILGEKLTEVDFSGTILVGADFSYANLSNSIYNDAKVMDANFTYTNLTNSKFINTSLDNSNFLGIGEVHSVAWSPDGRYIACAGEKIFIIVFKIIKFENNIQFKEAIVLHGHTARINSLKWTPDSKYIITGSSDDTIKVWDINLGIYIRSFPCHAGGVQQVQLIEDGRKIIALCKPNKLSTWDINTGDYSDSMNVECGQIKSMVSTKDGKLTFIGNSNGMINVLNTDLDTKNAKKVLWIFQENESGITSLCLSPDEKNLFSGNEFGKIIMWNVENRSKISTWASETHDSHRETVTCLIISRDALKLASGGKDKNIKLWNIRTLRIIDNLIEYDGSILSIDFSPCGNYLVNGGLDGSINLWNIMPNSEDFGQAIQRTKLICDNIVFDGATGISGNTAKLLLQKKACMLSDDYFGSIIEE